MPSKEEYKLRIRQLEDAVEEITKQRNTAISQMVHWRTKSEQDRLALESAKRYEDVLLKELNWKGEWKGE